MDREGISRRYAKAIYDIAESSENLGEIREVLNILTDRNFKELADGLITQYIRSSPENELETVRIFERVKFLQELKDMGENYLNEKTKEKR